MDFKDGRMWDEYDEALNKIEALETALAETQEENNRLFGLINRLYVTATLSPNLRVLQEAIDEAHKEAFGEQK